MKDWEVKGGGDAARAACPHEHQSCKTPPQPPLPKPGPGHLWEVPQGDAGLTQLGTCRQGWHHATQPSILPLPSNLPAKPGAGAEPGSPSTSPPLLSPWSFEAWGCTPHTHTKGCAFGGSHGEMRPEGGGSTPHPGRCWGLRGDPAAATSCGA